MNPVFYFLIPACDYRVDHEPYFQYVLRRYLRRQLPVSGGVAVIYDYCRVLNENGFAAHPVHQSALRPGWFDYDCRPLSWKQYLKRAGEGDVLVVPEFLPDTDSGTSAVRKVLCVQNGAIYENRFGSRAPESLGFEEVLTCSEWLDGFMVSQTQLPRTVVRNCIDTSFFVPDPQAREENRVLFLTRKHGDQGFAAVDKLPPELREKIRVVASADVPRGQLLRLYQQADVFMALGYPEGFGLPPLEAMACGCAVVGYTGGGGCVHMLEGDTALVAPDGDVVTLSQCLRRVLEDRELKERLRAGGLRKAQEFAPPVMERMLVEWAAGRARDAEARNE